MVYGKGVELMPKALEGLEKVPLFQKLQVFLFKQQQLHFLPKAREKVERKKGK